MICFECEVMTDFFKSEEPALWNLSWFKIFIVIKIENLKEKFLETWSFVLNIKCVGYLDT